jgi:hypothetical protein
VATLVWSFSPASTREVGCRCEHVGQTAGWAAPFKTLRKESSAKRIFAVLPCEISFCCVAKVCCRFIAVCICCHLLLRGMRGNVSGHQACRAKGGGYRALDACRRALYSVPYLTRWRIHLRHAPAATQQHGSARIAMDLAQTARIRKRLPYRTSLQGLRAIRSPSCSSQTNSQRAKCE